MYIATMYSETMIFKAIGKTEAQAKSAILKTWNERQKHMADIGYKEPYYFKSTYELDQEYGIEIDKINIGECIVY